MMETKIGDVSNAASFNVCHPVIVFMLHGFLFILISWEPYFEIPRLFGFFN